MTYKTKYGNPGRYNASLPTVPDGEGAALAVDSNGRLITVGGGTGSATTVEGTSADNAAATGNPVRVGGRYESGTDTYADGDIGDLHIDVNGRLLTNPGALSSATDSVTAVTNSESTNGSAVPSRGQLVAGSDGTNARNVSTDASGKLNLSATGVNDATIPTSSILIGARDSGDILRSLKMCDQGDGQSGGILAAGMWVDNGSSEDKAKSIVNATNSTGTGIQAVGIIAQVDDTSPTSVTENQFGNVRMSADHSMLVTERSTTPTQTSVAASASSVTLLSANNSRKGAIITNDSSAVVYIKLGATASTSSYTVTIAGAAGAPFSYYEVPFGYVGIIDAIWASATGNARITEIN